MFQWNKQMSESDRIKQNIQNMTELARGELAYDRDLGLFREWLDKPEGTFTAEMLSEITQMLNEKEPRVKSTIEFTDTATMKIVIDEREDIEV